MPEDVYERPEKRCEFRVVLFWYGGVYTSYNAKAGVKQTIVLNGRVDPLRKERAGGFHDKPVELNISSRSDSEWLERSRTELGVPGACGLVHVRAGDLPPGTGHSV